MQPPGPPFAFGHEIDLGESRGSEPSDDRKAQEGAVRITVPRVARPAPRAAAPLAVDARLLAVATEHLRRLGPKRVTVVAVAAEAGMTHANVYRYFPSKDALLDAVAGRWLRDVETRLAGIADAPDPADDKIERLLTALATVQRDALADELAFPLRRAKPALPKLPVPEGHTPMSWLRKLVWDAVPRKYPDASDADRARIEAEEAAEAEAAA